MRVRERDRERLISGITTYESLISGIDPHRHERERERERERLISGIATYERAHKWDGVPIGEGPFVGWGVHRRGIMSGMGFGPRSLGPLRWDSGWWKRRPEGR
jgi:hypothetical protein